jgi:hypothetical protein
MSPFSERRVAVSALHGWAERGRLFAIIDATDTPSVPIKAFLLGETRAVSLYRGRPEETLAAIAPYLVQVDLPVLEWITAELWTEPWGMFVLAGETLETLRRHFRHFLTVTGPNGESWYFRFYDPRVLERYIGSSTAEELAAFYGPVIAYGVTDLETYGAKLFTRGDIAHARPQPAPTVAMLA